MQILLSLADFEAAKGYLAAAIPEVKSSHRVEALARALGYATNAALRADLSMASSVRTVDWEPFSNYLLERGFDISEMTVLRSLAKVAIRRVMDAHPGLTIHGLQSRGGSINPADREALLDDRYVVKFLLAWKFVSRCEKSSEFLEGWTILDLKHRAEDYLDRTNGSRRQSWHIPGGCMIAAFLSAGFEIRQSPEIAPDIEVAVAESCLEAFVDREYLLLPLGPDRAASLPIREPIHHMGACGA